MSKSKNLVTTPEQLRLDLQVAAEKEVDGVGMGVLSDGTPFLTIRGLARMCGVDHTQIIRITADWLNNSPKPREQKIRELVRAQGVDDSVAFISSPQKRDHLPRGPRSRLHGGFGVLRL